MTSKTERIAKDIWNDRRDNINTKQDVVWYLDEYAGYYPLTEAEYDAVYAELIGLALVDGLFK